MMEEISETNISKIKTWDISFVFIIYNFSLGFCTNLVIYLNSAL